MFGRGDEQASEFVDGLGSSDEYPLTSRCCGVAASCTGRASSRAREIRPHASTSCIFVSAWWQASGLPNLQLETIEKLGLVADSSMRLFTLRSPVASCGPFRDIGAAR